MAYMRDYIGPNEPIPKFYITLVNTLVNNPSLENSAQKSLNEYKKNLFELSIESNSFKELKQYREILKFLNCFELQEKSIPLIVISEQKPDLCSDLKALGNYVILELGNLHKYEDLFKVLDTLLLSINNPNLIGIMKKTMKNIQWKRRFIDCIEKLPVAVRVMVTL